MNADSSTGNDKPATPHSVEAELAVLGAVLVDSAGAWPAVRDLVASDFYRSDHRTIFAAVASIIEDGGSGDTIIVADRLEADGRLDAIGGLKALAGIARGLATVGNVEAYVSILRDHAARRRLIATGQALAHEAQEGRSPPGVLAARTAEVLSGIVRAPETGARAVTVGDLLARDDAPLEFAVADLAPCPGTGLVLAAPKVGKTRLGFDCALAVSRGEPFIGRRTTRGRAVIFAFQESVPVVRQRLVELGARADDDLYLWTGPVPAGMRPIDLIRREAGNLDARYVLVDMLAHALPGIDVNEYGAMHAGMDSIKCLAEDLGAHVAMTHHTRKSGGEHGAQSLGSQAAFGGVDVEVTIAREPGTNSRYLSSTNRVGSSIDHVECVLGEDGRIRLGVTRTGELEQDILDHIADQGAASKTSIRGAIKGRSELVGGAIDRLAERGLIVRSRGRWMQSPSTAESDPFPTVPDPGTDRGPTVPAGPPTGGSGRGNGFTSAPGRNRSGNGNEIGDYREATDGR